MSVSPDFAPPGIPHDVLVQEQANLVETWVETILLGIEILLYSMTAYRMLTSKSFRQSRRRRIIYLSFITIQLILVTLGVAGNVQLNILCFVWNRNFPGGPIGFSHVYSNIPIGFTSLICFTLAAWMQDFFLLYRFLIIWSGHYTLFILPCAMFLTSVAFSCILFAQVGSSGAVLNDHREINTALIFFSLSVSLNAVLTTLIVLRILWVRRKVREHIGVEYTKSYLSVVSMLIESAALYTITGLAYIAAFKTSSPALSVIAGFYGIMPAMAPTLIAYRVCKGEAWTRETGNTVTVTGSIQFAPNPTINSTQLSSRSTRSAAAMRRENETALDLEGGKEEKDGPESEGSRDNVSSY